MNFFFGGCTKHKNALRDARLKKNVSWWNIFCELCNLVANRFKPKDGTFPETMDWRFLMMCLINSNKAGVVIDEEALKKAISDTGYTFVSVSSEEFKRRGLFGR